MYILVENGEMEIINFRKKHFKLSSDVTYLTNRRRTSKYVSLRLFFMILESKFSHVLMDHLSSSS